MVERDLNSFLVFFFFSAERRTLSTTCTRRVLFFSGAIGVKFVSRFTTMMMIIQNIITVTDTVFPRTRRVRFKRLLYRTTSVNRYESKSKYAFPLTLTRVVGTSIYNFEQFRTKFYHLFKIREDVCVCVIPIEYRNGTG